MAGTCEGKEFEGSFWEEEKKQDYCGTSLNLKYIEQFKKAAL